MSYIKPETVQSNYSIADVRAEFDRLDKKYGMDTTNIIFQVSQWRPKRWARWQWWSRTGREVCLFFVEVFDRDEEVFYNTIRQLYAQAMCLRTYRCNTGHDDRWRAMCKELGCSADRITRETTMFTYDYEHPYIADEPLTKENFHNPELRWYRKPKKNSDVENPFTDLNLTSLDCNPTQK